MENAMQRYPERAARLPLIIQDLMCRCIPCSKLCLAVLADPVTAEKNMTMDLYHSINAIHAVSRIPTPVDGRLKFDAIKVDRSSSGSGPRAPYPLLRNSLPRAIEKVFNSCTGRYVTMILDREEDPEDRSEAAHRVLLGFHCFWTNEYYIDLKDEDWDRLVLHFERELYISYSETSHSSSS